MSKTSLAITALVIVAAAAIGFYGFVATQSAAAQDFNTSAESNAASANECAFANCQQNSNAQAASIANGAYSASGDNTISQSSTQDNTAVDSFNFEN
jgi:hypothetical protein